MLKNYLKIAWRNIKKNRALFSINVIGLALGIATCLIISLFVIDELSYDRFHEKKDQIARVVLNAKMGDEIIKEAGIMAPVANTLVNEVPEVLDATRICRISSAVKATYGANTLRKGKMALADSNFLDIFSFPLSEGNAATALSKPNSVILTRAQAEAYFGDENPLNKVLDIKDIGINSNSGYIDSSGLYTVTGIIEIPDNSHFHFDLIASMSSNADAANQSWLTGSYRTYVLLDKGANLVDIENKLPAIIEKYMGPQIEAAMGITFQEFLEKGNQFGFRIQPLTSIHLYSDLGNEFEPGGDIKTVYIFGAIAILMLLIACFNFMNLSTAGASKRVKEIGMRKVLGSQKKQLVFQFLTESFIATSFAMAIGIVIFITALPYFNQLSGKTFVIDQILDLRILLSLVGMTLLTSILAGGYPAFFMSGFKPIEALRTRFSSGNSKGIRSGLVVFQFTISIGLIIATLVVGQQMDYIQNKDVGYDRDELIVIRDAGFLGNNLSAYSEELSKDPRIVNMTTSAFVPAGPTDSNGTVITSKSDANQKLRSKVYNIDENYIPTLGMKLLAGRNFSKAFGTEENNVIINETAVKTFGLAQNPVDQTLAEATDHQGGTTTLNIIGVVKDFHSRSLHEPIEPIIMKYNPYYGLIIKAKTSDMPELIANMEAQWKSFETGEAFNYAFLDALYNETYLKERNMNDILRIFAFLTVLVACLGLFGLVSFTAQQRFKEIGIRKVLGSSVWQIVQMLAKDFIRLVVLAMIVAFPLGYYFMNKWLQDFSYLITIEWWVFALAGAITMIIAFATISFKSFGAARMNPVKSLRTE